MATRQLGEPTRADLKDIKDISNWLTMEAWTVEQIKEKLLTVWALGHNQGYADANKEKESK